MFTLATEASPRATRNGAVTPHLRRRLRLALGTDYCPKASAWGGSWLSDRPGRPPSRTGPICSGRGAGNGQEAPERDLPGRAQREAGVTVAVGPDGEHLVQLDLPPFEAQLGAGQVHPPYLGRGLAGLGDAGVPVRHQVVAPGGTGPAVVLAKVLLVPRFQPGVLQVGDDPADAGQFPVREDVPVDEATPHPGRVDVVRPGDRVVKHPPAGPQLGAQEAEVGRVVRDPDVLGQPDRADRVEVV